jgi:crotonobetainyl-CoA:carnitine CoA-transferase CaiB-like acyl-CoA transferase
MADVTMGPVLDARQLLEDSFMRQRASLVYMPDPDGGSLPMHNVVPPFWRAPGTLRRPAPELGQDSADILGEIGMPPADIAQLCDAGVVRCST